MQKRSIFVPFSLNANELLLLAQGAELQKLHTDTLKISKTLCSNQSWTMMERLKKK